LQKKVGFTPGRADRSKTGSGFWKGNDGVRDPFNLDNAFVTHRRTGKDRDAAQAACPSEFLLLALARTGPVISAWPPPLYGSVNGHL
jgi:hypothetical protein